MNFLRPPVILELRIPMEELTGTGGSMELADPAFREIVENRCRKQLKTQKISESPAEILIKRRSFDFRAKYEPALLLSVEARFGSETRRKTTACPDRLPFRQKTAKATKAAVIGAGPAGLFCALELARAGIAVTLIERGDRVDARTQRVESYWEKGRLDPESNVQFGEGGAGTFSDGKLTTLIKEKHSAGREVLETFCRFGAPENILIDAHPHIGTDLLRETVARMREEIINLGGQVLFRTKATGITVDNGRVRGLTCVNNDSRPDPEQVKARQEAVFFIPADAVFLAIGHSARDTFEQLHQSGIRMSPKPMAVGLRIEHPQALINARQYGDFSGLLGKHYPAIYKLSCPAGSTGRTAFTFCMCPGGFVVNASSEPGGLVTNGMSYSARDSANANSAVLSPAIPADYLPYERYPSDPLAGIYFQRAIETAACRLTGGTGKLPAETFGQYASDLGAAARPAALASGLSGLFAGFTSQLKGASAPGDLTKILPRPLALTVAEGISGFGKLIPGFDAEAAILTGPESRSSSPVRIDRDRDTYESLSAKGLYPIGEGAGYAGGIVSAAADGLKAARRFIAAAIGAAAG